MDIDDTGGDINSPLWKPLHGEQQMAHFIIHPGQGVFQHTADSYTALLVPLS
jgi:hypothetical protein